MEQPPGSLDDPQHRGVPSSSVPSVTDLPRSEEECLLTSTSLDALRQVKAPIWGLGSSSTFPGLLLSETSSSGVPLLPEDQIQPDNALSHTTVTLSYVSRSHVSTHNSPLYSVSPVSRFSLHPHCNLGNGFEATGYALDQRYLEPVEEPVNLVMQAEPFPLFSQPQAGPEEDASECDVQEPPEFNGGAPPGGGCEEKSPVEEEDGVLPETGKRVENGRHDGWADSGAMSESSSETLRDEERGTSDGVFFQAEKVDPVVSESGAATYMCSVSREFKSPLEEPVSPTSTSLDDVEDVFLLPRASSSPSADGFYPEAAHDAAPDASDADGATRTSSAVWNGPERTDSGDESNQTSHRQKAPPEPLINWADDTCASNDPENKTSCAPCVNGTANVLERTIKERKLPMRSGRGTRLEAIVMNINSDCYRVSGCIHANKKPSASKPTPHNPAFPRSKRKAKATFPAGTVKRRTVKVKKGKACVADAQSYNDSTSVSELISKTETADSRTPAKRPRSARSSRKPVQAPQSSPVKSKTRPPSHANENSKKTPELVSVPGPSLETNASKVSPLHPPPKSPKNKQGDPKNKSARSRASSLQKTKAARAPKRRRRKPKRSQPSSMFSPKEPEIKLKYVNYKEERKDLRLDSFSPLVRLNRQQSSPALCTIINYPEEMKTEPKQRQPQAHSNRFVSAVVPSTSCLQLGRPSTHGQHRRALVCSLCGQSANSIDLGDLHGPYYPEGYRPNTKAPASSSGLKEDVEYSSDSDFSSGTVRARRWACSPGAQLKQKGLLGSRKWANSRISSPAAKQARLDGGSADVEDWYSPPVLPAEPCEYWLHEDCGVWSAGVFLVKGKVYGLEEAVKVAQETMCSACHNPGATLGCFFKGCPNKYHYRCALESDCVLVEENFSMKCRKHKNKTLKAPPGSRRDDR